MNCGDPFPPLDGYLEPYTSTLEEAKVNVVHVCQDGQLAVEESVCSSHGQWEVFNGSACTSISSKIICRLTVTPILLHASQFFFLY